MMRVCERKNECVYVMMCLVINVKHMRTFYTWQSTFLLHAMVRTDATFPNLCVNLNSSTACDTRPLAH